MHARPVSFIPAFLALIGTIIGAGVFGIPAVLQRTGFVIGSVIFLLIALLIWATHLLFLEIISRDRIRRRLPGYVGQVWGARAERFAAVTHSLQLMGANVAYLILGGEFLALIAHRFGIYDQRLFWQLVCWLGGVIVVSAGLRLMATIEVCMTWMLLAVMVIMIILAFPQGTSESTLTVQAWTSAWGTLGVFLFALFGVTVIPEVYEIAGKSVRRARIAVTLGSLGAAVLIWLFGVTVYLAAQNVDLSTPSTLAVLFPSAIWWILPLFGFLAVATSFITSAFDLQAMYVYDLKFRRTLSLLLTLGVPLAILFFVSRDFLNVINTSGALFGATNGFLVVTTAAVVMAGAARKQAVWWRILVPGCAALLFVLTFIQRIFVFGVH